MTPGLSTRRAPALLSLLALLAGAGAGGACFFAPDIAGSGYVACESDADCDPGRACAEHLCAPPPWNDDSFGTRRQLTVRNGSEAALAAGTAVPVIVGEGGILGLDDVTADFRVTDFDVKRREWSALSVFLDREAARFTAWIPLQREIKQGRSDVLAYIETQTADGNPHVSEDKAGALFLDFDGFDGDALDADRYRVQDAPNVADGIVNIANGQAIALRHELVPPVQLTLLARINGVDCSQVYLGLIGDDRSLFPVGPSAGLFVSEALSATAEIAPTSTSQITPVGDAITASTSFARVVVAVDGGAVRVQVDDTVAYSERDLRPPFAADAPMFAAVQVSGDCSVDVDALWVTPLPEPPPEVTPEAPVQFQLFQ